MEMCVLYVLQMCILCKVCILLFMYIVNDSYLVACTAMAQSFVPKNFTISTLVYMMCDNKRDLIWFFEIWDGAENYSILIPNQPEPLTKHSQ